MPSSPRRRTANSLVDSSGWYMPAAWSRIDAALAQLDHAAAHLVDHLAVVGGDDDGRAGAVDPVDQLHDPDRGLGVEVAGRLVGQQQRRVVHERARDRDALLLAARELVGVVVELGREPDQAQDVRHLAADRLARSRRSPRARRRRCRRRCGSAAACSPGRPRRCCGAGTAAACAAISPRSRPAIATSPAVGSSSFMQQADAGGLAAAGRADEEDELAAADPHRDALEADVSRRRRPSRRRRTRRPARRDRAPLAGSSCSQRSLGCGLGVSCRHGPIS